MATSGTFASSFPFDDLLTEAWERIGKSPAILNASVAESARRSLQLVLISWTNESAPLWQIIPTTLTLASGVSTVTLPAQFADVLDIYVTWNATDYILGRVGRSDYNSYSNKAITGRPTQVWLERQLAAPVLHLYPVPDQVYTATAYCLRQPQDVGGMAQTMDAPFLWGEALCSALAARLAEKFAPDRLNEKVALAVDAFKKAKGESRERVSLRIAPDLY